MVLFKKGKGATSDPPSTWFAWNRHGVIVVDLICPVCGKSFFLTEDDGKRHGISARGEVSPSVVCPFRCGFHEMVLLWEWCDGELPEVK